MKKFLFALSLALASFALGADPLTVAAAANLNTVAPALKAAFEAQHPDMPVTFVLGASGALTTQIQQGAPYGVFLSADTEFPQKLADQGLTVGAPVVYARGQLVLLSAQPRDLSAGLALLKDPQVTQVALANPETAPYGRAARQALQRAGLWDVVAPKVVTAQTIAQALQFAQGPVGLGLVHRSAVSTGEGSLWVAVPADLYDPIDQAAVVLRPSTPAALAFAAFLRGPEARAIFVRAGYVVP